MKIDHFPEGFCLLNSQNDEIKHIPTFLHFFAKSVNFNENLKIEGIFVKDFHENREINHIPMIL